MAFDYRKYVIISADDAAQVDFTEVLETSAETCRYSVDGTQTFVKYEGEMPPSISALDSKSQEYTHPEILAILAGEAWTAPIDEEGMV